MQAQAYDYGRSLGSFPLVTPPAPSGVDLPFATDIEEFKVLPKLASSSCGYAAIHTDPYASDEGREYVYEDMRGRYPIPIRTCEVSGVTYPAYTLSPDDDDAPQIINKRAIMWLIANGLALDTDDAVWAATLGVRELDTLDAYFATQAAIWMITRGMAADIVPLTNNAAIDTPLVTNAAHKLVEMAFDFEETDEAQYENDDGLPFAGAKPISYGIDCGLSDAFRRGCDAEAQDIWACGSDKGGVHWTKTPNVARVVCGRLLIGPFAVTGIGRANMSIEASLCGCTESFTGQFADICGKPLHRKPNDGEEFYVSLRVESRSICFTICVELPVTRRLISFARTDSGLLVAYANRGRGKKLDSCMCVCTRVPFEDDPPPEPQELPPIYYPNIPRQPTPPPLPPRVIDQEPIIIPARAPQPLQVRYPEEPEIILEPPCPPPPRLVIDKPPIELPQMPQLPPPPPIRVPGPIMVGCAQGVIQQPPFPPPQPLVVTPPPLRQPRPIIQALQHPMYMYPAHARPRFQRIATPPPRPPRQTVFVSIP